MKIQSAALTMTVAVTVALGAFFSACGSFSSPSSATSAGDGGASGSSQSSSGGAPATGGSSGGSGLTTSGGGSSNTASCTNVTPCGGSVVGTWSVTSSCLKVSGNLDLTLAGTGCTSAPVSGSLQVSGSFTANADGTYTDNTTLTGPEQITLGKSCLVISSTQVDCAGAANLLKGSSYSAFQCTPATDGGCDCTATVQQAGGLGVVNFLIANTSGNYTTSTSTNTLTADAMTPYSYCVASNTLTLTPSGPNPTITGSISLQNAGTGAGGSSGAGGTSAGGGSAGNGTGATGGAGGSAATGGSGGGGNAGTGNTAGAGNATGPCDIYQTGGTPCVAAHSTVRALSGAYGGKLYQVRNAAGTTKDISAVAPGGVADGAAQDAFCSGTTCVITIIYDQSGHGNDLHDQASDSPVGGKDKPASATGETLKVGGNKVYSLYIAPGNSYWVDGSKAGLPLGSKPEGMYMVTNSKHYNSGCCFDYGNSETDRKADGKSAMEAINFSSTTAWGSGAGSGPWIMADLELGVFAGGDLNKNAANPSQTSTYVTAVLKNNGTTQMAIRGGDATTGALATYYSGALPSGWSPMKKQGAIVLGSGGDCCVSNNNLSDGTFYEGCIVSGYPTDATENAVQANIVAISYGK